MPPGNAGRRQGRRIAGLFHRRDRHAPEGRRRCNRVARHRAKPGATGNRGIGQPAAIPAQNGLSKAKQVVRDTGSHGKCTHDQEHRQGRHLIIAQETGSIAGKGVHRGSGTQKGRRAADADHRRDGRQGQLQKHGHPQKHETHDRGLARVHHGIVRIAPKIERRPQADPDHRNTERDKDQPDCLVRADGAGGGAHLGQVFDDIEDLHRRREKCCQRNGVIGRCQRQLQQRCRAPLVRITPRQPEDAPCQNGKEEEQHHRADNLEPGGQFRACHIAEQVDFQVHPIGSPRRKRHGNGDGENRRHDLVQCEHRGSHQPAAEHVEHDDHCTQKCRRNREDRDHACDLFNPTKSLNNVDVFHQRLPCSVCD